MKKITLLLVIILWCSLSGFSQNSNWIIGSSGRLDFSSGTSTMVSINTENGPSLPATSTGYTSVSDGCGKLLFVTDGHKAWTYNNGSYIECSDTFADMPRNDIRQNVAIVPRPNNLNNFYIFTVTDTGVYCTDFYVETDGSAGHVESSFKMDSTNGYTDFQCTALSANVQKYFGSNTVFKSRIMLFNQSDSSLYTYYITENGIDITTQRTSLLSSYISSNSYVNNFTSMGVGTGDTFAFSTNLGDLVVFNLYNYYAFGPVFYPIGGIGTEVTGLSFSSIYSDPLILYVATVNGLYKSVANGGSTYFDNPVSIVTGNIGDLQMGNDGKIYGALQGESTLLQIGDPDNNLQPNVNYLQLGFVNPSSHLGQLVIRNPKLTYLNLIAPTFNPIGPFCYGTNQTLPTTSANGITGTWSPAYNKNSSSTYTFTPNANQCSETLRKSVSVYQLPTITAQPTSPAATCSGAGTQTLSVTATGSSLTYSWTRNGVAVTNGGGIIGQGTKTLTLINPTAANAGTYQVGISTATCPTSIKASNSVTVTVNTPPAITIQPTTPTATCSGTGTKTISVTATGTGLTYSWRRNGVAVTNGGAISGQGSRILTLTNATAANAGSYTIVVSGTCSPAVTSNAVTFTVNSSPTITAQPTVPTVTCSGSGTQTLSVTATGAGLTYSWQKNGVPLVNGGVISGQGTASLTLTNATTVNTGSYTVVVSGTCSPAVTSIAVTVAIDPVITPLFNAVAAICSGDTLPALPTTSTNGVTGTWSPVLDNTLTTNYTFTPSVGQCANTATLTIAVNEKATPTFSAVAAICSGDTLAALPLSSTNGITGTWSPALNNAATTTYTFTPSAGQCANTTTKTITVNTITTPTFNAVAAICSGSTLSPLPTTSLNGVAGTWSPALNDTETTTYTFTPSIGQCAVTTTMTIEVDYIIPTFDDVAIISTGTINYEFPEISTNGITGYWDNYMNEEGEHIHTFWPDEGQCAKSTSMTFILLMPKKLEANDDDFVHAIPDPNPPTPVIDKTVSSVLENDLDWDTFGDVTLSVVSMSEVFYYPYITMPVLNQNGTITFPLRFWVLYDSISITYKITQNSCPSNYATATVNISSYDPNSSTARKATADTANTDKSLSDRIAFYPNPSNGIFNIDLTATYEKYNSIKVYNILGAVVYESRLNVKSLNEIDLSHVADGYYTARLFNSGESSKAIKLIKN